MITKFGSDTLGTAASTEKGIKNLLGNKVEFSSCHLQQNIRYGCKENEGLGDANIQRMQKKGGLDEICMQSSIEGSTLKFNNRTVGVVPGHKSHGLSESHGKHKTLIQKVAPTDMLWDGYLQLNSSVTVSAVAFFKSGEKMPNVKWSEAVEVKGQVKLDAFENYIQDLPRSRNRGLMVISLHWKEGSSKLGLAGMKKVAKRYEEGEKVGFAQLLSGIDLYVCPRSETIITILARHGFFKGRTAIEENKDSLIGCVVWRRNQINPSSVQRISEKSTYLVSLSNKSPTPLPSEESLESSQKNHTTPYVTEQKDRTEKGKSLSISPQRPDNSFVNYNVLTGKSTPNILTPYQEPENQQVPVGRSSKVEFAAQKFQVNQQVPVGRSSKVEFAALQSQVNQQVPVGRSSKVEFAAQKSQVEQQDLSFRQPRRSLVRPPSDVAKEPAPILDSEDLPEFDFGTACGLAPSQLNSQSVDGKLFHEGYMLKESCPTLHKRRLENVSHQEVLSNGDTLSIPPQKKFCRHDYISQLPLVVGRQSRAENNLYSTLVAPSLKSRFDDDDMPEWCPPVVDVEKQLNSVTNQSLKIPIPSVRPKLVHSIQAADAQNLFSPARVVHSVQAAEAQYLFSPARVVHSVQAADAQNLFSPARVVVDWRPPFFNPNSQFTFLGPVNMQKHERPVPAGIQIGKVRTSRGHQL